MQQRAAKQTSNAVVSTTAFTGCLSKAQCAWARLGGRFLSLAQSFAQFCALGAELNKTVRHNKKPSTKSCPCALRLAKTACDCCGADDGIAGLLCSTLLHPCHLTDEVGVLKLWTSIILYNGKTQGRLRLWRDAACCCIEEAPASASVTGCAHEACPLCSATLRAKRCNTLQCMSFHH